MEYPIQHIIFQYIKVKIIIPFIAGLAMNDKNIWLYTVPIPSAVMSRKINMRVR